MLRLWFLRINAVYLDPRFAPLCLLLFIIQELSNGRHGSK